MRAPKSVKSLQDLGRVRLSENFFLRDFLHSEIGSFYGIANIPDDPDLAVAAGTQLCTELLEPLQATFGRLHLRSGYRSENLNRFGNENDLNCARNDAAGHVWDQRDAEGCMGATACVVVPWVWDRHRQPGDWQKLAWWIHDHLPYSAMEFFPKYWAFNLSWHERPKRRIDSFVAPKGCLTKPGMPNNEGDHSDEWRDIL